MVGARAPELAGENHDEELKPLGLVPVVVLLAVVAVGDVERLGLQHPVGHGPDDRGMQPGRLPDETAVHVVAGQPLPGHLKDRRAFHLAAVGRRTVNFPSRAGSCPSLARSRVFLSGGCPGSRAQARPGPSSHPRSSTGTPCRPASHPSP